LTRDNLIKNLKKKFFSQKKEKKKKKELGVALGDQGVAWPPQGAKGMAKTTPNA
jgi:hypothetical protein